MGFTADRTMRAAQSLYEAGLITYLRTDGINISTSPNTGEPFSEENPGPPPLQEIRNVIVERFGDKFLSDQVRVYKSKVKNSQEAHEAIRPTNILKKPSDVNLPGDEEKLYKLIWDRTVASQMENSKYERKTLIITSEDNKYEFVTNVHVIDPSFTIHSKRMDYYTELRHAYFYGATTIQGESYNVECNRGFFDSNLKKGYFQDRASIEYNLRNIQGDSIYFDDRIQYAAASQNVQIKDTIGDHVIRGQYGEIFKERDSAIVTRNPMAIKLIDKDSLYILSLIHI